MRTSRSRSIFELMSPPTGYGMMEGTREQFIPGINGGPFGGERLPEIHIDYNMEVVLESPVGLTIKDNLETVLAHEMGHGYADYRGYRWTNGIAVWWEDAVRRLGPCSPGGRLRGHH